MFKRRLMLIAVLCLHGGLSATAHTTYVPLRFRTVSGIRPFVEADMGGVKVLLMIHSNANFNMMTTHGNAKKAGVTDVIHVDHYGISSAGHVSKRGREKAVLTKLIVAGKILKNMPILVFEIPQDPPVDGMLGRQWLSNQRVILDYNKQRMGIPESTAESESEDQRLLAEGYTAHSLEIDLSNGSYQINGMIGGHQSGLEISTVGEDILDIEFAKTADIPIGPAIDRYAGPRGSLGKSYIAKRAVDIVVDGQRTAPARPLIYDTYAYDSAPRPAVADDEHKVRLGADFLLANEAVIDFGTRKLFLRSPSIIEKTTLCGAVSLR